LDLGIVKETPLKVVRPLNNSGFTLLELLVVLVVIAIGTALVSAKLLPDDQRLLDQEAERLAQILTIAQEEAEVKASNITFRANAVGFQFTRPNDEGVVQVLKDDFLSPKNWQQPDIQITVQTQGSVGSELILKSEPSAEPCAIELRKGSAARWIVRLNSGRFRLVKS
jgi:general secretion pathway protein H